MKQRSSSCCSARPCRLAWENARRSPRSTPGSTPVWKRPEVRGPQTSRSRDLGSASGYRVEHVRAARDALLRKPAEENVMDAVHIELLLCESLLAELTVGL